MTLIPHAIPLINDPQVVHALAARWRRTRTLLLLSAGVLPVAIGIVCVVLAGMTSAGQRIMPWWSAIPAVAAAACAWALLTWLRRNGLSDPHSWLPATTLMTGAQLVLGVLPGSGIALRLSPGAALAVKALCAAGVLGAGSASALARMAHRSLLSAPVLELGSTAFPLVLDSSGARVVIGTDRVDWTTRTGARVDAGLSFARILRVTAQAHSIKLHTASGSWTVPVADPATAQALLLRRITWWEELRDAAAEREQRRYLDLVGLLAAVSGEATRGGISVTVDSNGLTTGITLSPAVRELEPEVLAAQLMACVQKARADARRQVQDLVLDHADGQLVKASH
ncbi:YbaB/EbfC family nucleoid-associated protein [Lentzea sp. NEAU-D7]|uniref:YbaB/EbfC family nucleoid-associated protein n=1 Tax=Lentzea sp. NEAU-D7 TaxID=2994667 RepID=UPI00224B3BBD|nr:YbaB/EbfC family nucleoid-associated protein [Lentzea sp. NEAU-D7]MCX2949197.1 YbaB/EbfC family nucleoid-associated protein [Lentzea sp. NEAU-D7]